MDEDKLPIAAAKIEEHDKYKDALTIIEAGSMFKKAGNDLFQNIIEAAKNKNKRYIVAEDLTSPEALEAMKKRGFEPTTKKAYKRFKGHKIHRPGGRSVVQKNLVLDLGEIEKKAYGGLIDKPLIGGSRYI